MFNSTIVDRRTTTQEVNNHSETNVEASGVITQTNTETKFISLNVKNESYKTVFSSNPYYTEKVQDDYKYYDNTRGYEETTTKVFVKVKQVMMVGSIFTLEVEEISKQESKVTSCGYEYKNQYYKTPTII